MCGLFGTVISLERAVALDRGWALAAPVAFGSGGVCILIGAPAAGPVLFLAGVASLVQSPADRSSKPGTSPAVASAAAAFHKVPQPGIYAYVNHNPIEAVDPGAAAEFKVEGVTTT